MALRQHLASQVLAVGCLTVVLSAASPCGGMVKVDGTCADTNDETSMLQRPTGYQEQQQPVFPAHQQESQEVLPPSAPEVPQAARADRYLVELVVVKLDTDSGGSLSVDELKVFSPRNHPVIAALAGLPNDEIVDKLWKSHTSQVIEDYYRVLFDLSPDDPLPKRSGSGDGVCGGPPADAVPLDWGMPLRRAGPDPNNWPAVIVEYGAGTDANILPLTNLLNKTFSWSVDLSQAGCQNVVAFQMVDAKLNEGCYCDGNNRSASSDDPHSPGNCKGWMNTPLYGGPQPCTEVDFMESNIYTWSSTLHNGLLGEHGWDYGFGGSPQETQGNIMYNVGSSEIDTSKPFHVRVAFPVYDNGTLSGMETTLSQGCLTGPLTIFTLFPPKDEKNLTQLQAAIQRGMTPGFSYWNTDGPQPWFDGKKCFGTGKSGGPVVFYNWALTNGTA